MSAIEDKIIRLICKNWMITLLIIASTAFYVYVEFFPLKEMHYSRMLNGNLVKAVEQGQTKIDVKDLVDFSWDKVCFLTAEENYLPGPPKNYMNPGPRDRVYEILGTDYTGYTPYHSCGWLSSMRLSDLLFIKDGKAVMILPLKDCRVHHSPKGFSRCYGGDAYINVQDGIIHPRMPPFDKPYKELTLTDSH